MSSPYGLWDIYWIHFRKLYKLLELARKQRRILCMKWLVTAPWWQWLYHIMRMSPFHGCFVTDLCLGCTCVTFLFFDAQSRTNHCELLLSRLCSWFWIFAKIHIYTGRLKHQISRAGMTHFRHYGFRCHIVGEIVRFYGLASIKKNLLIQLSDSLTTMERHTFNKPKRGRQLPRLWIVSTLMRLTNR